MQSVDQQLNRPVILKGVAILSALLFGVTLAGASLLRLLLGAVSWQTMFFISRLLFWGCLAFAWYYCVNIEKQRLLLWPERRQPFWVYLLSVIVIYIILSIGSALIFLLFKYAGIHINQAREKAMLVMLKGRYALIFFTCLTAGIVEELLFRAYLIARLAVIFGNRYLAVVVSSALFGLLHFGYNNWLHVASTFFIGFVFALHYLKFRNIKILIICHFLWDIIILLARAR